MHCNMYIPILLHYTNTLSALTYFLKISTAITVKIPLSKDNAFSAFFRNTCDKARVKS